jgi:glycosyltransferase involved in cell wall biosynthesis
MSLAKTIVVSPQALEGIEAEPGRELLLADDAPQFAAAVLRVLAQPQPAIGAAARRKVESRYGWAANLAQVDTLLENTATIAKTA